jgi:hypothetical protein
MMHGKGAPEARGHRVFFPISIHSITRHHGFVYLLLLGFVRTEIRSYIHTLLDTYTAHHKLKRTHPFSLDVVIVRMDE